MTFTFTTLQVFFFFFFNDTATTEIYTLSLHDALPISAPAAVPHPGCARGTRPWVLRVRGAAAATPEISRCRHPRTHDRRNRWSARRDRPATPYRPSHSPAGNTAPSGQPAEPSHPPR